MKKTLFVIALLSVGAFSACQKEKTVEERKDEVQAQPQEQPAQPEQELTAPEKARPGIAQRPATESYDIFYTRLQAHGSWFETTDYGFVWQPREAQSAKWRPYRNGHWVYTDVGWAWVSEEPFGWATYHYGRWARLRDVGWVWVPGEEWAPAWVSWRKSDDYVGWAPLPPEARFDHRTGIRNWADNYYDIGPTQYCFVPTPQFGTTRIEQTIVPPEQNITIINRTTNVTNITFNNVTVVNEGPNYDEIRAQTQQPIPRLKLKQQAAINSGTGPQSPVVRGDVLEMSAPVVRRARPADRPREVKQRISQVMVEKGWSDAGDAQAVTQIREKMKAEATPPPDVPKGSVSTSPPEATAQTTTSSVSPTPIPTSAVAEAAPSQSPLSSISPAPTPIPNVGGAPGKAGTGMPVGSEETEQPRVGGKLKSQARRFNPRRVEPQPSATPHASPASSATASPTATSAANADDSESSPPQTRQRPNGAQRGPSLPPRRKPGGRPERPNATSATPAVSPAQSASATPTAPPAHSPSPTAMPR